MADPAGQAGHNSGQRPAPRERSEALHRRALRVLPGGNSRHTVHFDPFPVYAVRGQGSRVWDADGVERIDFINNYSSLIHGHCHPVVTEAVIDQARKLASVSLPTEAEIELAEIITARLPTVEQVRFCNSGSEAVLYAVKLARAVTGRSIVARIEGAYHGSTETATVSSAPTADAFGPAARPSAVAGAGQGRSVAQDVVVLPLNDVDSGRAILRAHAADLAGVLIDPMPSALAFTMPTPAFLAMIREELDASGGLLIFDEVYSLRLGYRGAQEALGVSADITALGKIIGGGLPIGAVGASEAHMSVLDPRGGALLAHGGTFNANPLTMAAGAAAIRLFDEAAFDRLSGLGERLRKGLKEALAISGKPGSVTGAASLARLGHSEMPVANYRDMIALRADPVTGDRRDRFFQAMLDDGILMAGPGIMALSTANTAEDVDQLCERALAALRRL